MKRLTTISESLKKVNKVNEAEGSESCVPLAQLGSTDFWKIKTEEDYLDWWAKEMGMSVDELKAAEPGIEEVAKKAAQITTNSLLLDGGNEALPIQFPTVKADKYDSVYIGDDGSSIYVIATNLKDFGSFVEASAGE